MEKAIKELRNKMALVIYDMKYDDLLTNHKIAINDVLKAQFSQMVDKYAYATIL